MKTLATLAVWQWWEQSQLEYMGGYAHIYIYYFFLLKNISNKMTIRQAPHANTLICHAYSPAKPRLFPGRLLPSFPPKTPAFST
jgi:hypothetical protein